MKKRVFVITFIFALILTMFAQIAVFADDDDYGADAHSESMNIVEEDDYEGELSYPEMIKKAITDNIRYLEAGAAVIILVIVLIKVTKFLIMKREPKYKGKH